jgi:hypothetical protein
MNTLRWGIVVLFTVTAVTTKPRAEESPSLKQTTDWLAAHMNRFGNGTGEGTGTKAGEKIAVKLESARFDGCKLSYIIHTTWRGKSTQIKDFSADYALVLSDLDASKVQIVTNDQVDMVANYSIIHLETPSGALKISHKMKARDPNSGVTHEVLSLTEASTRLPIADSHLAQQVVKAFVQAITLCKNP